MSGEQADAAEDWRHQILPILKSFDVKHIVYVPDAGHAVAIRTAEQDNSLVTLALTTEEEGIGYLAGAWLGRARRAADAVERRRQLHQHAGAAGDGIGRAHV